LRDEFQFILLLTNMLDVSALGAWDLLTERIGAFVARRVPNADAEDVRQEVLIKILKGAPHLHDEARFGPWVYSVARNSVIDWLRAKRLPTTDLENVDRPIQDDAETQPLLDCVAPFVASLPSPYREAVTLVELRGLTQQEAADISGVTLSGMKSRVQRGRKMLRTMFEDCCRLTVDARGRVIEANRRGDFALARPSTSSCTGACHDQDPDPPSHRRRSPGDPEVTGEPEPSS
jgi:RNA polymerase sigma-70 factor (ECF subfamily)